MKLLIDNSTCQIQGLTPEQLSQLKGLMCYNVENQFNYYTKTYHTIKKYLITKTGHFPTGLLYIAKKWIEDKSLKDSTFKLECIDARKPPIRSRVPYKTLFLKNDLIPYEEQTNAALACLNVSNDGRGIISAPTGSGKSLITALIIDKIQVKTLIVVPSLSLKSQLTATLCDWFGKKMVGPLNKKGEADKFITVENVDALDTKKILKDVKMVIIDEFHHSASATYRKLNEKSWSKIYYRFGLTATPFRSDDNERLLLESVLSKIIYKIYYTTAVEKKYIVPVEAYYVEIPKSHTNSTKWAGVYSDLVVNNQYRNKIISDLLEKLNNENVASLCLVKEIAHGESLSNTTALSFVHGTGDRNLIDAFNTQDICTLIGTSGVLGEGIDTKPAEFVIIAGLGKSKNAFMQQVGRCLRTYPGKESGKVIIFKDESHKWTKNHFSEQVKILLDEYGVIPTRLF